MRNRNVIALNNRQNHQYYATILFQMLDILITHFDNPDIQIDFEDAHKRIKFIETRCKHYEAPFAGKPFILMLFQKAFIEALYSFKIYDEEVGRWVRLYQDFLNIFLKESSERLPAHSPYDHVIELVPEAKGFHSKVYPLVRGKQEELDKFITEQLQKGYIRPLKSSITSPFFFIKKKSGDL